ncbi:hypothetical protein ACHAXS_010140 [Conticribra weissflogii]
MFSWANKQLEKLSETLAPPPSIPTHRFLSALASQNEPAAAAILNDPHEPLDPYALIHPSKGTTAVHVAASHGSINILRDLILHRGVPVETADYQGWTPLHHAAHCSSVPPNVALSAVKFLVEDCGACVLRKNSQNQTAYDVGNSQAVRGYLLPKQLQLETQECLNNGGRGLMPGIDMGGMKVNYANVAPPPLMGGPPAGAGLGPPPTVGMMSSPMPPNDSVSNDPSAALMQPPPVRVTSSFAGSSFATQPVASTASTMPQPPVMSSIVQSRAGAFNNSSSAPVDSTPVYPGTAVNPIQQTQTFPEIPVARGESNAPPTSSESTSENQPQPSVQPDSHPPLSSQPEQAQQPVEKTQHQEHLPVQQIQKPPTAPTQQQQTNLQPPISNSSAPNSGYALRGGNANSAFVLDEKSFTASGRRLYKPDGFHTSSNDKELQKKYGHVENDFEKSRKLAIPPPPTSAGGATLDWNNSNTGYSGGSIAHPALGGANPYSAVGGNSRVTGYIGGSGRARYPTYCAVSDSVSAPPSLNGMGVAPAYGSAAPSYVVFNPNVTSAANNNYSSGNNVQMVQTQQWAADDHQSMQAGYGDVGGYGATPASGNGAYGTYGYDQQHYSAQQQPTAQQWNAPPAAASNTNDNGKQTQYTQWHSSSPHQNQQQQKQQYETGCDAAATMFATPPPRQNHEPPGSTAAQATRSIFTPPPAVCKTTSSPPSGSNIGHASATTTTVNVQDIFASPPSTTETTPKDHFSSPPLSEDANTSTQTITVADLPSEPSANDHFALDKTESSAVAPPTSTTLATSSTFKSSPTQLKSFGGLPPPPSLGNFSKPSGSKNPSTPTASRSFLPPPPVISADVSSAATPLATNDNEDDGPLEQLSEVSLNDS